MYMVFSEPTRDSLPYLRNTKAEALKLARKLAVKGGFATVWLDDQEHIETLVW